MINYCRVNEEFFCVCKIFSSSNTVLTPTSSTNILSKPTGPSEDLTILAIDTAAVTVCVEIIINYRCNKINTNTYYNNVKVHNSL